MSQYQPISCDFHDIIESCATQRRRVSVEVVNEEGDARTIQTVITDVFARNGCEYLQTQSAETIRLDRVLAIDGLVLLEHGDTHF